MTGTRATYDGTMMPTTTMRRMRRWVAIRVLAGASRRTTTRINLTSPVQNFILSGRAGYPPPR